MAISKTDLYICTYYNILLFFLSRKTWTRLFCIIIIINIICIIIIIFIIVFTTIIVFFKIINLPNLTVLITRRKCMSPEYARAFCIYCNILRWPSHLLLCNLIRWKKTSFLIIRIRDFFFSCILHWKIL